MQSSCAFQQIHKPAIHAFQMMENSYNENQKNNTNYSNKTPEKIL